MLKKLNLLILVMLLGISNVWAISLHDAKNRGLVGEANTGLLAVVKKPPANDVKQLVDAVNKKRKAKFKDTARANNISVNQVAERFYQRAVQATEAGHYYQSSSGSWVKK